MILLGPGEDVSKIGEKDDYKIQVIVLKIKYREFHEFYFLGLREGSNQNFHIGCKQ